MSIQAEVQRLASAKSGLASAIAAKGVTVPEDTKLDGYAALVEQIQAGGITQEEADARYLQLAGGTLTGNLIFDGSAYSNIYYQSRSNPRINFGPNSTQIIGNGAIILNPETTVSGDPNLYIETGSNNVLYLRFRSCDKISMEIPTLSFSGSNRAITGIPDPVNPSDAVSKQYVDNLIGAIENGSY